MAVAITSATIVKGTSQSFAGRRVSAADHLLFVERMRPAAVALIEQYAPSAPVSVQDESTLRLIGGLLESGYGSKFTSQVKPINNSSMFRTSGAQGLLYPWHARRAGAC